jgi:hypothetical protein
LKPSSETRPTKVVSSYARDFISKTKLRELKIERDDFHGDWNGFIRPATNSVTRSTSPFPAPIAARPSSTGRTPPRRGRTPCCAAKTYSGRGGGGSSLEEIVRDVWQVRSSRT